MFVGDIDMLRSDEFGEKFETFNLDLGIRRAGADVGLCLDCAIVGSVVGGIRSGCSVSLFFS